MSVDARNRLQPSLFDRLIDDQRSIGSSRSVARSGARSDTLAMRASDADARGIRSLSDLADRSRSNGLSIGLAADAFAASGGFATLRRFYGLPPLTVVTIERRATLAALTSGQVDLVELHGDEAPDDERIRRLADDRGFFLNREVEADAARVMSKARFREAVLRDLSALFNATQPMKAAEVAPYPLIGDSVLNYGMPPLSGQLASVLEVEDVVAAIRHAILRFEPRVMADTLDVRAVESETVLDTHNVIEFEIRGHLWSQPLPIEILLRTKLDLEAGQVAVLDR